MNKEKQGFSDPKTILAIILTFGIFMGWQAYLNNKYPDAYKNKTKKDAVAQEINQATSSEDKTASASIQIKDGINQDFSEDVLQDEIAEKILSFKDDIWSFEISSKGMSVGKAVIYKFNKVSNTKPYKFSYVKNIYPTEIDGKLIDFDIKQEGNKFIGKGSYKGSPVTKTVIVNSDLYTLSTEIDFDKAKLGEVEIFHKLDSKVEDPKKAVFFLPAFDRNEFFVKTKEDSERKVLVSKEDMEAPSKYENVSLASLGDHYFSTTLINKGKTSPNVLFFQKDKNLNLGFNYSFNDLVDVNQVKFDLFLGPKKIGLLSKISKDLPDIVNFSYLGFIAKPILKGLNFFYGIFGNYGIAVIVLTFLIRLMILPLAVSSFRSMKKMQTIQPELKRIKEKYKDQPQVINQKTMAIMKDNKVNPLGGCLPMLLQLPIFFAFYRGLSESVDLYQAPFAGWITDLSKMDPYFILPILSMAGMVIHQLVTPSTMDKAQKRMMMIMPVVFGALFVTLPSALTLYMAVSTWFGIGQHAIFLRDKKPS